MDRKYKVGGYVKLAKLWERSKDAVVAYHSAYYAEKFKTDSDKKLVGVYIDITGNVPHDELESGVPLQGVRPRS